MDFNVFFSQNFAEKVTKIELSEEERQSIKDIYKRVKRIELTETCHNCFTDAYFDLFNKYRSNKNNFIALYESEYRMPAGAVLSDFGDTTTITTAANVTNELAEYHLKKDSANIKHFNVYPQDWLNRITQIPKKPANAYQEPEEVVKTVIESEPVVVYGRKKPGRPSKKR